MVRCHRHVDYAVDQVPVVIGAVVADAYGDSAQSDLPSIKDKLRLAKVRRHKGDRLNRRNAHAGTVMVLYKDGIHVSDIAKHEEVSRTTVYEIGEDQQDSGSE